MPSRTAATGMAWKYPASTSRAGQAVVLLKLLFAARGFAAHPIYFVPGADVGTRVALTFHRRGE
jgi:hypothetical protein